MQYVKIPKTICDEIEKLQRGFLWGDSDQRRKAHLVSWDVCCLPKMHGGLGFKQTHHMNEAFLMKMIWNLIKQPGKLWCRVLYRSEFLTTLIKKGIGDNPATWQTTFMTTCWYLRNWRNKSIFEIGFQRPCNPTLLIQKFTREIEDNTELVHKSPHQKETVYIGWV